MMSDDPYFQADIEDDEDSLVDDKEGDDNDADNSSGSRRESRAIQSSYDSEDYVDVDSSPSGLHGPLRKGKWTGEEETYANKIILYFNKGLLGIACGTTLRSYLSEKLNCDPMRITKKFAGASCIGKQVYQPADESSYNKAMLTKIEEELKELQRLFLKRLFSKSGGGSSSFLSLEMDDSGSSGISSGGRGSSVTSSSGILAKNSGVKPKQLKLDSIVKPKRITSAPDLSQLNLLHQRKPSYSSLMKRQRSISLMDLEHYAIDDDAAGDLLIQFMEKISESTVKKPKHFHQHTIDEEEEGSIGAGKGPSADTKEGIVASQGRLSFDDSN